MNDCSLCYDDEIVGKNGRWVICPDCSPKLDKETRNKRQAACDTLNDFDSEWEEE